MRSDSEIDQLIKDNLWLARMLATQLKWRVQDDYDEAYQLALIGMYRAARNWNSDLSKFSSFAGIYVRRMVMREYDASKALKRGGGTAVHVQLDDTSSHGRPLSEIIADERILHPSETMDPEVVICKVRAALAKLAPRDRDILTRRFGLDGKKRETFKSIGCQNNTSKQSIQQQQNTAMKRLREQLKKVA